ncbi:MAG: hypothetical protein ACTSUE_13530 [Promethearchaeota archaeon]
MSEEDDDVLEMQVQNKHDLAAKALNNPVRKRILEVILDGKTTEADIIDALVGGGTIPDGSHFKYHVGFLLKAECVRKSDDSFSVTKAGEAVKFM